MSKTATPNAGVRPAPCSTQDAVQDMRHAPHGHGLLPHFTNWPDQCCC
jgi:hypothetical protein